MHPSGRHIESTCLSCLQSSPSPSSRAKGLRCFCARPRKANLVKPTSSDLTKPRGDKNIQQKNKSTNPHPAILHYSEQTLCKCVREKKRGGARRDTPDHKVNSKKKMCVRGEVRGAAAAAAKGGGTKEKHYRFYLYVYRHERHA